MEVIFVCPPWFFLGGGSLLLLLLFLVGNKRLLFLILELPSLFDIWSVKVEVTLFLHTDFKRGVRALLQCFYVSIILPVADSYL